MIVQLINNNFNKNCNAKKQFTSTYINQNERKDLFLKTTPAFKGYKGFKWYGTESNRNAVNYVMKITPSIIDENLEKSASRDDGIIKSYNALAKQDYPGVMGAFNGLDAILKDYKKTYIERCKELKVQNPEGTEGISLAGLLGMTRMNIVKNTPKLFEDTKNHINDIRDDFVGILDNYWDKGIIQLCVGYYEAAEHIKSKLYSGYPPHEQIKNGLDLLGKNLIDKVKSSRNEILEKGTAPDFYNDSKEIYNTQEKRQTKRFFMGSVLSTIFNNI